MKFQFILTAPSGLISTKTFIDLYSDLITVTVGQRPLPEAWSALDQIQVCLRSEYNLY